MELFEIENKIEEIRGEFRSIIKNINLDEIRRELKEIEEEMKREDFWRNKDSVKYSKRYKFLKKKIEEYEMIEKEIKDYEEFLNLIREDNDLDLKVQLESSLKEFEKKFQNFYFAVLFSDEDDSLNAILNIHPGAGGTESCDWAEMLYRMYLKWAKAHNFKVEEIDITPGEEAGKKNVTLLIKGENVYGLLKCETGIHRLVRISPFNAQGKRQTSFCSIYVVPEISDEVEVEINEKDLRIDTYRSSGAGGQHVNTTDSAVRITHLPTGIVVQCQNERSQIQNRETAMKILRSRLYDYYKKQKEAEINKKQPEKTEIGWGNQIRSYVLHPYQQVKDHRTNYVHPNPALVLDGDLDDFILEYLKFRLKYKKICI